MSDVLRVAVVGAGPAGLYTADSLLFQQEQAVGVDVFDRLPTPFGLLRYGVAPDHLKMKSLSKVLQRTLDDQRLRFFGGVQVGTDVTVDELREHYDVVVYAFGAAKDRRLEITGEELVGSESATRFVHWYSGHPDVATDAFDLRANAAVVVGVGNVAVDVTRLLLKDVTTLRGTDIPASVLAVLEGSAVEAVHVLGRRGPAQATFTSKELKELGELDGVDVIVDPAQLILPEGDEALVASAPEIARNLHILREWASRPRTGARRRLHLHFWSRPVELIGPGAVTGVVVERTEMSAAGVLVGTGETQVLASELVLRSVGYRGVAVDGVPFEGSSCTVPSIEGRVLRDGVVSPGEYVVGWIGRGPVGVLGTNRSDAEDVVGRVLADAPELPVRKVARDIQPLLLGRGISAVDCEGWRLIDAAEVARGEREGRAREKIAAWQELYAAAEAVMVP
jgi:ferredoxin--NADP+ reductase